VSGPQRTRSVSGDRRAWCDAPGCVHRRRLSNLHRRDVDHDLSAGKRNPRHPGLIHPDDHQQRASPGHRGDGDRHAPPGASFCGASSSQGSKPHRLEGRSARGCAKRGEEERCSEDDDGRQGADSKRSHGTLYVRQRTKPFPVTWLRRACKPHDAKCTTLAGLFQCSATLVVALLGLLHVGG